MKFQKITLYCLLISGSTAFAQQAPPPPAKPAQQNSTSVAGSENKRNDKTAKPVPPPPATGKTPNAATPPRPGTAPTRPQQARPFNPQLAAENLKKGGAFRYQAEQFADIRVLRYQVPGWEQLKPTEKEMLYYLYEAALAGRDIMWDQNYKWNLTIRRTLENIISTYRGDRRNPDYQKFLVYAKRVWFSNGIHHHYSSDKILPEFTKEYFAELINAVDEKQLPLRKGQDKAAFISWLTPIVFDPSIAPKKVSLDASKDLIASSAINFYEGVTEAEVKEFYKAKQEPKVKESVSHGLNSKVVKENGKLVEKTWKVGGMYDGAVSKIVYWLEKALPLAENNEQKAALEKLIQYHKTGDLKTFDEYNIAWVKDVNSTIDVVNGYIEVYEDPLGYKGAFESCVSIKDFEASKRISAIGAAAQWFEDNAPVDARFKKKEKCYRNFCQSN